MASTYIRYEPRGNEVLIVLQNQTEFIVSQPLLIRDFMIPGQAFYGIIPNPWWGAAGPPPTANTPVYASDVGFSIQLDNNLLPLSNLPVHLFTPFRWDPITGAAIPEIVKKWNPLYWIIKPDTRMLLIVNNLDLYDAGQIQPQIYMRGYVLNEDNVEHNILPKYIHSTQITHIYGAGVGFNTQVYFSSDSFMIGFAICRFYSDPTNPTNIYLTDLPLDIPPAVSPSPYFTITEVKPNGSTVSMTNQQNFRFAYGTFDGQLGKINYFHRKMNRGQYLYLNAGGIVAPAPPWNIGDWISLLVYCLDKSDIEALIAQPHLHRYLYPLFPSENIAYEMIQAVQEGVCET